MVRSFLVGVTLRRLYVRRPAGSTSLASWQPPDGEIFPRSLCVIDSPTLSPDARMREPNEEADVDDPYQLERFVRAQAPSLDQALAELRQGAKTNHIQW